MVNAQHLRQAATAIVRTAQQNALAAAIVLLQGINASANAASASACANAARLACPAKTAATRAAGTSACRPVADQIAAARQQADAHAYVQTVTTARQTAPATEIAGIRALNAQTDAEVASATATAAIRVAQRAKTAATRAAGLRARQAAQAIAAALRQAADAHAYVIMAVENARMNAHARPTRYRTMETVATYPGR